MNISNYEKIDTEAMEALWAISFREDQQRSGFTLEEL
jgi:hypothetical protein